MVSMRGSSTSSQRTSVASKDFRSRFVRPRSPSAKHTSSSSPTPGYRIHELRMALRRFVPGARGPDSTPASTRSAEGGLCVVSELDEDATAPQDRQRQEKASVAIETVKCHKRCERVSLPSQRHYAIFTALSSVYLTTLACFTCFGELAIAKWAQAARVGESDAMWTMCARWRRGPSRPSRGRRAL